MAGTLKIVPTFLKFNTLKEKYGTYFRFTPRSIAFVGFFMGVVPTALTFYAYGTEGVYNFNRQFRQKKLLVNGEEYVPRAKDL